MLSSGRALVSITTCPDLLFASADAWRCTLLFNKGGVAPIEPLELPLKSPCSKTVDTCGELVTSGGNSSIDAVAGMASELSLPERERRIGVTGFAIDIVFRMFV